MKAIAASQKRLKHHQGHNKLQRTSAAAQCYVARSNHIQLSRLQQNTHERQADVVAERMLRGETQVSRYITSVSAASVHIPSSRGEALPTSLRRSLEKRMDADLAAVRIHRDPIAQVEARRRNALAFTAGSHIYFAANTFDLISRSGQKLLLHELAHTLQQTGRYDFQGRLRVTDIQGSGAIQYQNGDETSDEDADSPITLQFLIDKHRNSADAEGVADLNQRIEEIGQRLHFQLIPGQPTDAARALERDVLNGQFQSYPRVIRSLLFDCLKQLGLFAGATVLLDQDPEIKTIQLVAAYATYLGSAASGITRDWYFNIIPTHSLLQPLWYSFLWTIRQFVMDPYRPIQNTPNLRTTWERLAIEALDLNIVSENERVLIALNLLNNELEPGRLSKLRQIDHFIRTTYPQTGVAQRMRVRSLQVVRWAEALRTATPPNGGTELIRSLGDRIHAIGDDAAQFWTDAIITFQDLLNQLHTGDATAPHLRQPLPEHEQFTQLQATLESLVTALFDVTEEGTPLPIAVYAERNTALQQAITTASRSMGREMGRLFASRRTAESNTELLRAFARVLRWLEEITFALRQYSISQDREQSQRYTSADVRVAHRIRVARTVQIFAINVSWSELEGLAVEVLTAFLEGHSLLALVGDWTPQPEVPVETMRTDFSSTRRPILRNTPLTVDHLVMFFRLRSLQALNETLSVLLEREEENLTPREKSLYQLAEEQVALLPVPRRYQIDDFEFAFHPDDQTLARELLEQHPKTIAFLEQNVGIGKPWDGYILPNQPAAFIWLIPPLDEFIQRLRSIPELNDILAQQGEIPQNDFDWLAALANAEDQLPHIIRIIRSNVVGAFNEQVRVQRQLLRRLTTLRRRTIAPSLAQALEQYGEGDIEDYSLPNQVLDHIENFRYTLQPRPDERPQVAALILQMAPAIRAAFLREGLFVTLIEERYDLITGYFEYLEIARTHTTGEDLARMQAILNPNEDTATLQGNVHHIEAVIRGFNEVRLRVQRQFGFKSENGRSLTSLTRSHEVLPGSAAFWIDGDEYQLVEVYRAFIYHPPYGRGTGGELAAILTDPDETPIARSGQALLKIILNGEEITVTDRDDEMLTRLSHVIEMHAIVVQLEHLAETMEDAALLALDLAEFIPGIGQGITIARVIEGVVRFLAVEFPAIRDELMTDPYRLVEELQTTIHEQLTPEHLFEFLILAGTNNPFERFRRPRPATARPPRRIRGRLGHLINAVKRIGGRVADAFLALQRQMGSAVLSAQAKIAARPTVAFALRELPNVLINVSEMAEQVRQELTGDLLEEPEAIAEAIAALFEGFQEFELPREVIPLDLVVEAVLVFFLDRFGARGRLIRRALEATGTLSRVSDPIAQALRESAVDPNQLWTEHFLPELNQKFTAARDGLVNELYNVIDQVLPSGASLARIPRDELPAIPSPDEMATMEFSEAELEVDLYSDSENELNPHSFADFALFDDGIPLPAGLRTEAEQRFGHDFHHVRLHIGIAAAEMLEESGAEGLTTGSHVVIHPSLSLSSSMGRRILFHELAHVLQQTGARPLGDRHNNNPVTGHPGKGLHRDARREAAAERMAETALQQSEQAPIPIEEEGGEGWLPSLADVALRIFRVLSRREFGAGFLARVRTLQATATDVPGHQQAEQIWDAVLVELRGTIPASKFARFLRNEQVRNAIQTYLSNREVHQGITLSIAALASLAQRPQRRGRGSSRSDRPSTELNPARFANLLEAYVFERTGIALRISLRRNGVQLQNLEVRYVDLGRASRNADVWRLAKQNTDNHTYRDNRTGQTLPNLSASDWRQIYQQLRQLRPEPMIWDGNEYRLHNQFIQRFFDLKAQASDAVAPTWMIYTTTDPAQHPEQPGLKVGTHEQLTSLPPSGRAGRQSHHIPQYLLVQYFRNMNPGNRLWHTSAERLPGFEPATSAEPERFVSGQGQINLRQLDPGSADSRGLGLPAILLAADTHTRGNLHLNREPTWNTATNELQGTRTQGNTINNFFRRTLKRDLGLAANASDSALLAIARSQENTTKNKIYAAMKTTYAWMYSQEERSMKSALNTALHAEEVAYYAGLAARDQADETGNLPTTYNPEHNTGRLSQVLRAIETKNQEIMSEWR